MVHTQDELIYFHNTVNEGTKFIKDAETNIIPFMHKHLGKCNTPDAKCFPLIHIPANTNEDLLIRVEGSRCGKIDKLNVEVFRKKITEYISSLLKIAKDNISKNNLEKMKEADKLLSKKKDDLKKMYLSDPETRELNAKKLRESILELNKELEEKSK